MTDKQIIEYKHTKCTKEDCCLYCGSIYCGYVDDIENLEKAYKAKEQECEELKDKLSCCFCNPYVELDDIEKQRKCVEVTECFRRQLDQLKAENDNIKETFDGLFKVQYKLADNNKKLRQTLTEIKEIAEENDELLQGYHKEWANNKLILQKISECEVE